MPEQRFQKIDREHPLTYDYILTHTPAQIAAEHSADSIQAAFDSFVPSVFTDPDTLFNGMSMMECANEIADADWSEQLLTEWYDECDLERPCDAEDLTIAIQLHVSLYIKRAEEYDAD